MFRRLIVLFVALALVIGSAVPAAVIARKSDNVKHQPIVTSKADAAKAKIHPKLLRQLEAGNTGKLQVYAVVNGSAAKAKSFLTKAYVAKGPSASMVVGKIRVQALAKLASVGNVVSVGPIEFRQTGRPLGSPEPVARPSTDVLNKALQGLYDKEVPYSEAPPLAGSNFEELKDLALLDAKTHNFAEAWEAGYTGAGVTVGVMDGGTDFGHPDLIGTWRTWSGLTGVRAGWNGWPKAFDPFGTLQWLAAPSQINQGLSWYTRTTALTCKDWANKAPQANCAVRYATKTGPSRNFGLPTGTAQHTYRFPAGVSKSGNVRLGSHPDDYLLALFGERPAFLVTDKNTAGVYDTIYVDLDNDQRFDDEKPVSKASPAAYRDMDGDSFTDLSGGLVAYISDGASLLPGGIDAFAPANDPATPENETLEFVAAFTFAPGAMVMWSGDFDPGIGGHGTLTASNVVGQGVINGKAPEFSDVPGGSLPGMVIGGAPDAKLAPYGDIYFSFDFSIQFGYFLATHPTRGIDITSNSYGSSAVDNDPWDAASQEADIIYDGGRVTPLFSTGNGAPGFGTEAPPSPSAGIAVGASTQFGGTGWDSIDAAGQIVDDDVMVWSNRGPGANGSAAVDVVADGAFSAGDATLNTILSGNDAWATWGGTSRSAPVAAGATALIYQSYKAANGGSVPAGFYADAKRILKSSAEDLGYDGLIQGAGSIDAAAAVAAAAGDRATVSPDEWRAGDYRGDEFAIMSDLIAPGGSDSQALTIDGGGSWTASDRQMVRTDSQTWDFSSANLAQESVYNFNAPDYLIDLSDEVASHPNADLMVVRLNFPRNQWDLDADYDFDQTWRLLTYDWTDVNDDGNLWTDANGNGVVNHVNLPFSTNIDHNLDLNFAASEIDQGEYVRFMYHRAGSNALQSFVRNPADRMSDGLFVGLQHSQRTSRVPVTDFEIRVDWYQNQDWDWVSTSPTADGFEATIDVPEDTPYGMYSGAVVLEDGNDTMVVPITVAVAATASQDENGALTGALEFGGSDVADDQADLLYNNGSVFGANDWTWRAESGDWRFFFFDVPEEPADGSLFLARTTWEDAAPYTDLDTLIMGPSENGCQLFCGTFGVGDYPIIDTVGGSPNTHVGSGVWLFDTATGGAEDLVAAPVQEGLHSVVVHQVGWDGGRFHTPFSVTVGGASVAPAAVDIDTAIDTGSFDVTFTSGLDLDGLTAEAYGLSQPSVTTELANQDDPGDPSSASVKKDVTLEHASRLNVSTALDTDDLDLFLVFDDNGDGNFTNDEIIASSATAVSNEHLEVVTPEDGDYQVWVQGFSVAEANTEFELTIDPIQGNDLTVDGVPAGAVPAGQPVTLTVSFSKAMVVGETYFGELLLGPPSAPTAISVPISITRT